MQLTIRDGLVVTPHGVLKGGIAVDEGRIVNVGSTKSLPQAKVDVDARGAYILPGLIDPHVHIGTDDEDRTRSQFITESQSAVVSGVTTVLAFVRPGATLGYRLGIYEKCKYIGSENSHADFKFHAYIASEAQLEEIPALIRAGITSAKLMFYREDEVQRMGLKAIDLGFAYRTMKLLSKQSPSALLQVHCEEPNVIFAITEELKAEGRNDYLAWTDSRPGMCEAMHAFSVGLMSKETKCPIYIVHVSAKETIDVIMYLRRLGSRIYAETCPHYLTLSKDISMGPAAKMAPPLRDLPDIDCLWQAVSKGIVDTIGSDHVARLRHEKEDAGMWNAGPGVGGVGAVLPLMISEGVNRGRITIEQLVKVTSENAARIWGLYPSKGVLCPGADADIVIVDPHKEWVLSATNLKSASDYSVYEGKKVKGKAVMTFLRGTLVAKDGEIVVDRPSGKYV